MREKSPKLKHFGKPKRGVRLKHPRHVKDEIKQEGMMDAVLKSHSDFIKHSDVNYALLHRWLHSQVGKLWNDVWSMICSSTSSNRIRDYYSYFVSFPVLKDGELIEGGRPFNPEHCWTDCYWVDPRDGILKFTPYVLPKRSKNKRNLIWLNGKLYFKFGGIWYRVRMTEVSPETETEIEDVFFGRIKSSSSLWKHYGSTKRYATWKQSANSKEIRRLNALVV